MDAKRSKEAFVQGEKYHEPQETLWDALSRSFKHRPSATALTILHQDAAQSHELKYDSSGHPGPGHLEWSFANLEHASDLLARQLSARGVGSRDTCTTFLENPVEWCVLSWASIRVGFTLAPLDALMVNRPEELEYYLTLLKPKVVIVANYEATLKVDGASWQPGIKLVADRASAANGWESLTNFALAGREFPKHKSGAPLDTALLISFTSGTTGGQPKGCVTTQRATLLKTQNMVLSNGLNEQSRYLIFTVNFRTMFPTVTLYTWLAGGTVVIPSERFDTTSTIDALISQRCTHTVMLPSGIMAFAEAASRPRSLPEEFHHMSVGGDIITRDLIKRAKSSLGQSFQVWTAHGMTEGGGITGWLEDDDDDSEIPATEAGILSIGRPLKGAKAKVVDTDTERVLKRGEKGHLHLSSPAIVRSYLEDRNAEDFYQDEDGWWFKTGDLGVIDERDYIYILGRSKDIIKYHAVSLSPAVLEGALNKDDDVVVKVVGLDDSKHGTIPVAVVKCSSGREGLAEKLKKDSFDRLGEDYRLHHVYFLQDLGMSDFPLNATGKVVRTELQSAILKYNNRS